MSPSASEVNAFHDNDDVDASEFSHHHTLGSKANQAAPGNVVARAIASDAEVQAGVERGKLVTPASLASLTATDARAGLVEKATTAEVIAGTDDTRYVSPKEAKDRADQFDWVPAIASGVASTGATATLDTTTGTVTLPSGTTMVRVDGLMAVGYEYEVSLQLSVQSGHATDNSVWMRLCEGGVPNTTASYNSAGLWSQYNGTWGVYTVGGGSAMAIGAVSGASSYTDFVGTVHVRPGFDQPKIYYLNTSSVTSGSARHTEAGHYTPASTGQYDGMYFIFNGAATGLARGKIRFRKRKLI